MLLLTLMSLLTGLELTTHTVEVLLEKWCEHFRVREVKPFVKVCEGDGEAEHLER